MTQFCAPCAAASRCLCWDLRPAAPPAACPHHTCTVAGGARPGGGGSGHPPPHRPRRRARRWCRGRQEGPPCAGWSLPLPVPAWVWAAQGHRPSCLNSAGLPALVGVVLYPCRNPRQSRRHAGAAAGRAHAAVGGRGRARGGQGAHAGARQAASSCSPPTLVSLPSVCRHGPAIMPLLTIHPPCWPQKPGFHTLARAPLPSVGPGRRGMRTNVLAYAGGQVGWQAAAFDWLRLACGHAVRAALLRCPVCCACAGRARGRRHDGCCGWACAHAAYALQSLPAACLRACSCEPLSLPCHLRRMQTRHPRCLASAPPWSRRRRRRRQTPAHPASASPASPSPARTLTLPATHRV